LTFERAADRRAAAGRIDLRGARLRKREGSVVTALPHPSRHCVGRIQMRAEARWALGRAAERMGNVERHVGAAHRDAGQRGTLDAETREHDRPHPDVGTRLLQIDDQPQLAPGNVHDTFPPAFRRQRAERKRRKEAKQHDDRAPHLHLPEA
jgi:hypothetical protein